MKVHRWLLPILLPGVLLVGCAPSITSASRSLAAEVTPDWDTVVVFEGDEVILEYTLGEWREWAQENLTAALGGPVRIGQYDQPPSAFNIFGAAAPSPDGERLAVSTSAYAMLTTVSVIGVLDLTQRDLSAVDEPAFGGVQEFLWSPDATFVAYPLDTARAAGDKLRVDNIRELKPAVELAGADLLEVATSLGLEVTTDARQWLPEVRNLEWTEEGRLLFTSNGLAGGELRWSLDPETGELTLDQA